MFLCPWKPYFLNLNPIFFFFSLCMDYPNIILLNQTLEFSNLFMYHPYIFFGGFISSSTFSIPWMLSCFLLDYLPKVVGHHIHWLCYFPSKTLSFIHRFLNLHLLLHYAIIIFLRWYEPQLLIWCQWSQNLLVTQIFTTFTKNVF